MKTAPWNLSATEFSDLLKRLRFRYFKWDAYCAGKCVMLPESIVLSRAEHLELVRLAESWSALLGRVEEKLHGDPVALRKLAIPEPLFPLIAREPPDGLQITRYDFFPAGGGRWYVSEFNEDVPGGYNEAGGVPELLGGTLPGGEFAGSLREAVVAAFAGCDAIALMFATGYSEDLQHMLLLEAWFEAAGQRALLCSPGHLEWHRGNFFVAGTRIEAAFRFYPGEWIPLLPNLPLWQQFGAQLRIMNPLRRMIRQSKLLFSTWLEDGVLEGPDLETVRQHAPWSEPFEPRKLDDYLAARERWVLKQAFGRMGESVVMGKLSTPEVWKSALGQAVKNPGLFTIQECFEVEPLDFAAGRFYPAIGVYLVNGRFAGYYSRVAPQPFLTHDAYHVATLVEAA